MAVCDSKNKKEIIALKGIAVEDYNKGKGKEEAKTFGKINNSQGNGKDSCVAHLNKWMHIALSFDGEKIILYKDGTLISSSETKSKSQIYYINQQGCIGLLAGSSASKYRIDELRLWNKALDSLHLNEFMNCEISNENLIDMSSSGKIEDINFCENLMAYFKFNESSIENWTKDWSCNQITYSYSPAFNDTNIGETGSIALAVWLGTISNDWNDQENWKDGIMPSDVYNQIAISSVNYDPDYLRSEIVTPPGVFEIEKLFIYNLVGDLKSTGDQNFSNLKISETSSIIVEDGSTIEISETLENKGRLEIEPLAQITVSNNGEGKVLNLAELIIISNAQGTASLICDSFDDTNPDAKPIIYQRHISTSSWHDVSPPIKSATGGDFPNSNIYKHVESLRAIGDPYIKVESGDTLKYNEGYLSYLEQEDNTIEFEGFGSSDEVVYTLTSTMYAEGEYYGWNLIGNPYSSAISWDAIISDPDNQLENLNQTIYILDASDLSLHVYNPSLPAPTGTLINGNIPMGQGFFIQIANGQSATLTIKPSHRVHDNSNGTFGPKEQIPLGKKATSMDASLPENYLELYATYNNQQDEVQYRWNQSAKANQFDSKYDAYKLNSWMADVPNIYFKKADIKTSMHQEPESKNIDLGFELWSEGIVSIGIRRYNSFDSVVLHDKLEDKKIELTQSDYQFYHNNNSQDRFEIIFTKETLGENDSNTNENFKLFASNGEIKLENPCRQKATLALYDLQGRQLMLENIAGEKTFYTFSNIGLKGIFIAKITSEKATQSKKIMLD